MSEYTWRHIVLNIKIDMMDVAVIFIFNDY